MMHETETGQQGLAEVAHRRRDVILLDLDGLTVLRRLREWSRIPVLILTVRDSDDDKVAALDAGAADYVTKPFSTPNSSPASAPHNAIRAPRTRNPSSSPAT